MFTVLMLVKAWPPIEIARARQERAIGSHLAWSGFGWLVSGDGLLNMASFNEVVRVEGSSVAQTILTGNSTRARCARE